MQNGGDSRIALFLFYIKLLTIISSADIITISIVDITANDNNGGVNLAYMALTEAVYYILISLLQPMHGYGIMQNVDELSNGRVKLAAGTLYGALNTLLERGWIMELPTTYNTRKKEYIITDYGKRALELEYARLQELVMNGDKFVRGHSNEKNG